jgi:ubiquinol oxidase
MTAVLDTVVPTQRAVPAVERDHAPGDPPKLSRAELARTHAETLSAPRRNYSLAARLLFVVMDLLYGRAGSVRKYRVLEVVARVPYQSWETVEYKRITRTHRRIGLARRLMDRVLEFRAQQDNETWHLLVLAELVDRTGERDGRLRYRVLPWLMAIGYWHLSWLLYVIRPAWSHRLNADFEDHAEHEYAEFVRNHPELEEMAWSSTECAGYGSYASVADLLRQISHDERCHKHESEAHLSEGRLP